jgi:hypothetical protein
MRANGFPLWLLTCSTCLSSQYAMHISGSPLWLLIASRHVLLNISITNFESTLQLINDCMLHDKLGSSNAAKRSPAMAAKKLESIDAPRPSDIASNKRFPAS